MEFILKFLVFIVGIGAGVAMMYYNYQLVQLFGHQYYAEKYLGDGGTYSMWKILGILVIIGCVWYVFR